MHGWKEQMDPTYTSINGARVEGSNELIRRHRCIILPRVTAQTAGLLLPVYVTRMLNTFMKDAIVGQEV
jgi:hypothetical protein